jgi:hypothetical protein
MAARAMGVRCSGMGGRLGIRLTRLQREAGDVQCECLILTCDECCATSDCDCYLQGEAGYERYAFLCNLSGTDSLPPLFDGENNAATERLCGMLERDSCGGREWDEYRYHR